MNKKLLISLLLCFFVYTTLFLTQITQAKENRIIGPNVVQESARQSASTKLVITGILVDDRGKPVANWHISVLGPEYSFVVIDGHWIRIDTKTDEKGRFKLEVDRDNFSQDICIAIIYKEPGSDHGIHLPLINKKGKPLELKISPEMNELDVGKVKMKKK